MVLTMRTQTLHLSLLCSVNHSCQLFYTSVATPFLLFLILLAFFSSLPFFSFFFPPRIFLYLLSFLALMDLSRFLCIVPSFVFFSFFFYFTSFLVTTWFLLFLTFIILYSQDNFFLSVLLSNRFQNVISNSIDLCLKFCSFYN